MATPRPTSKGSHAYSTRSTPQTLTLGAGDDFVELDPYDHSLSETIANEPSVAATRLSLWFPKRSSPTDDSDEIRSRGKRPQSYLQVELQEKRQGLLSLDHASSSQHPDISPPMPTLPLSMTSSADPLPEEKIQQDCSFFYRSLDQQVTQPGARQSSRFRAVLSDSYQSLFHYRDAVDVLSPPVLSHYRARYQQLNQEIPIIDRRRQQSVAHTHDLQLHNADDDCHITTTERCMISNNSVQLSSLLYQHKGRVLLRLPQDHVRLLMDRDLPVGKLSVCQWRTPSDDNDNDLYDDDDMEAAPSRSKRTRRRPSLQYVLTVPEDLYCRVVGDMSQGARRPFCNIGRCCNEDDHVNIGVAVAIVALFMILLLVVGAAFGDS